MITKIMTTKIPTIPYGMFHLLLCLALPRFTQVTSYIGRGRGQRRYTPARRTDRLGRRLRRPHPWTWRATQRRRRRRGLAGERRGTEKRIRPLAQGVWPAGEPWGCG